MRWSPAGRMLGACQRDRHRPRDGPGTTRGAAPGDRGAPDGPDDTLKYEEVYLKPYETFAAAEASIGRFIGDVDNTKRLHSGLGYASPERVRSRPALRDGTPPAWGTLRHASPRVA